MNALQEQFVTEARDLIHQATDDLIALENGDDSDRRIDRVFRAFHTLKGSAGVVELPAMVLALHAAEDLLSAVKAEELAISGPIIDRSLRCLDQISAWVDSFEEGAIPADAGERARNIAEDFRKLLPHAQGTPTTGVTSNALTEALPDWVSRLVRRLETPRPNEELQALAYVPEEGCFFNGDDPVHLMRQVPGLVAFRMVPREAWRPLAELDPFACNLRFEALSTASRDEIAPIFRLVPDQITIVRVASDANRTAGHCLKADALDLVRAIIEEQIKVLADTLPNDNLRGRIGAAGRTASNTLRHANQPEIADGIAPSTNEALESGNVGPLVATLENILENLRVDGSVRESEAVLSQDASELSASRTLRIEASKIDALVNLAGELLVSKNMLNALTRQADGLGDRLFAQRMRRQHESLERLTSELQTAILQLRMLPVAQLFRSFPRLVRDTAQRLGKKALLVTHGEAVECDKNLVERLFEPLMHLVRNAVDHGIESPEARREAGKAETGAITLAAQRKGDRLVVTVADDGRGIDPDAIRRAGRARHLLPEDEVAGLSDEEAIQLVFLPGFSTRAGITELSGRGVGADVVRTTVAQIGGRTSVETAIGVGTTFTLDLPISIAMSRIMVVELGGQLFGIVMDAVAETVRLRPDGIRVFKGNEGFVLRERVIPICALAELMQLPQAPAMSRDSRLFVVVDTGGKVVALEVDAIRDRLDVILKPMEGVLMNSRVYAGTTMLGDGTVLLILNLQELLP